VANERSATLRCARDAPARKFANAGASLEKVLAAIAFLTGGGKGGKEEDGLNETQSGTDAISPFWGDAYKQASTDPHPLRLFSVRHVRCGHHRRFEVLLKARDYTLWLIFGLHRGIGLAATSFLLETYKATVIAISRTRSSELDALATAHPETLQIVQCNMLVLFGSSLPSLSLTTAQNR
jgi:hypothetical protein